MAFKMKGHTLPGPNQRATDPVTKKTQDNLNKNIQSGIKTKQESKVGAIGRRAGISGKGIQAILNVKPPKLKPISTTSMQKGFGEAINKALAVSPKKSPTKHRLTKRVPLNVDFDRLPKSYPRDRAVVIEHDHPEKKKDSTNTEKKDTQIQKESPAKQVGPRDKKGDFTQIQNLDAAGPGPMTKTTVSGKLPEGVYIGKDGDLKNKEGFNYRLKGGNKRKTINKKKSPAKCPLVAALAPAVIGAMSKKKE